MAQMQPPGEIATHFMYMQYCRQVMYKVRLPLPYEAGASHESRLIFITADCLCGKETSPSL